MNRRWRSVASWPLLAPTRFALTWLVHLAIWRLASALSAQHVILRLTGQRSDIEGDAADALCINMWALEHFLAPLPRKFKRP